MTDHIGASIATAGKECTLGTDPAKFLEKFEDWFEHHELLADTVGVQATKKLQVLLLWGGKEFRKFAKDAGVVTVGGTPRYAGCGHCEDKDTVWQPCQSLNGHV